jgi:site-specific recombinase XerD
LEAAGIGSRRIWEWCCESAATISKRVKTARQFFRKAVARKVITENPFDGLHAGSQANKGRVHFVSRQHT